MAAELNVLLGQKLSAVLKELRHCIGSELVELRGTEDLASTPHLGVTHFLRNTHLAFDLSTKTYRLNRRYPDCFPEVFAKLIASRLSDNL